jgi:hypothetical protein
MPRDMCHLMIQAVKDGATSIAPQTLSLRQFGYRSGVRYNFTQRSRRALAITLTDDNDIASAPITGDSRMPNIG